MSFFKNRTKIELIKTVELGNYGWETSYHTRVNGQYVINSTHKTNEKAEEFFEKVLKNKGINTTQEVIRQEFI